VAQGAGPEIKFHTTKKNCLWEVLVNICWTRELKSYRTESHKMAAFWHANTETGRRCLQRKRREQMWNKRGEMGFLGNPWDPRVPGSHSSWVKLHICPCFVLMLIPHFPSGNVNNFSVICKKSGFIKQSLLQ
jgi:hypothetical protein